MKNKKIILSTIFFLSLFSFTSCSLEESIQVFEAGLLGTWTRVNTEKNFTDIFSFSEDNVVTFSRTGESEINHVGKYYLYLTSFFGRIDTENKFMGKDFLIVLKFTEAGIAEKHYYISFNENKLNLITEMDTFVFEKQTKTEDVN